MIKNTFKLVFVYALILGIAGALVSGFINTGLIIFSLIDDWLIGTDPSSGSFESQNNYIAITINKIIAAIIALAPLVLLAKLSTGAFIWKPLQLLSFTGRAGLNTVNKTGRGLFNAARNGIGNSVNAIRSIAKGDPMSMYRSARYAEMALGRDNKLSEILRRGADISDLSKNLAGNKGEAQADENEESEEAKGGLLSKINEKTQPKDTKDLLTGRAKRDAALSNIKKAEKARKDQLKKEMKSLDPESDAYKEKEKELKEAQEAINMARKGILTPGIREKTRDKYDDFVQAYDQSHENLQVTDLKNNNVPGAGRMAQNFLNNHLMQILNASSTPAITPTNAEGERGVEIGSHLGAPEMDAEAASKALNGLSEEMGNPMKHMTGQPDGQTDDEERQEVIDRIERDGRGILSPAQSAAQLLGSSAAIYGAHLNPMHQFDSNATSQHIQQGHVENAESYRDGVQAEFIRENLSNNIKAARRDARIKSGLFTLDNSEYEELKRNHEVGQVSFMDDDYDMIGFASKAAVYRRDSNGNKAVRFSNMEVRDSEDPDIVTTLKEVDVLLDQESQNRVKKEGFSNEEIVRGLAEGTLGAVAVRSVDGENGEKEIGLENISFIEQVRREVELKDNNYNADQQNNTSPGHPDKNETQTVPEATQPEATQHTGQKDYQVLQPGETRTIQGAPVSNSVTSSSVDELNRMTGERVARIGEDGEVKISLDSKQIERLSAMRHQGKSERESKGSEDTANFINNILDAIIPGSSSSENDPSIHNDNSTNNVSNYRSGDNINFTLDPSTGRQTIERSSRNDESSDSAPDVTLGDINKDLYKAQQEQNTRMIDEQLERSQEQIREEEKGNRLEGPREE